MKFSRSVFNRKSDFGFISILHHCWFYCLIDYVQFVILEQTLQRLDLCRVLLLDGTIHFGFLGGIIGTLAVRQRRRENSWGITDFMYFKTKKDD